MNIKILLLLIILSFECYSQDFSRKELRRIEKFGLNLNNSNINQSLNINNLNLILEKERKRKTNKTAAILISSLSAITTAYGLMILSETKNDQEGLGQSIGTMVVTAGAIKLGISIPLFISSNKRKKERNELIKQYKINNSDSIPNN